MSNLTTDRFAEFFDALHSYAPFPWQQRLAERLLTGGDWPGIIDIPTAAGKTACIDIAVYALACQAGLPAAQRSAPRRVFFVVDRRIIVDEAYQRACHIATELEQASIGILAEVAAELRRFGGQHPLDCVQLRGGVYRDDHWIRDPLQPTVLASTVDQIGSRLLYRGYGLRSDRVSPIHTGLAANDALIILDEAHCANPFRQTLDALLRYRSWTHPRSDADLLTTPFSHTLLSATPADTNGERFSINEQDRDHPILGTRIHASKPTRLLPVTSTGGKALQQMANAIIKQVLEMLNSYQADDSDQALKNPAIGIIVNRVDTARRVYAALAAKKTSGGKPALPDIDRVLLTGRMRPIDRDAVVGNWLKKLTVRTNTSARPLQRPVVVVATQTLEVGANLDFDALIAECASLDALRQRFGRLNRGGQATPTRAAILARSDQIGIDKDGNAKNPDPVYGDALARSWDWLTQGGTRELIDLGFEALTNHLPADHHDRTALLAKLSAPSPDAAVLLPSHLDLLVQTAPRPAPDPDVSLFLHGPQRGSPDVLVAWRADLTETEANPDNDANHPWIDAVALCPPSAAEFMPVPLYILRAWIRGEDNTAQISDADGSEPEPGRELKTENTLHLLRWAGPEDPATLIDPPPKLLRPGDTLILPESVGGWEQLGHIPAPESGVDQAEAVRLQTKRSGILRLHPALLARWPDSAIRDYFIVLAGSDQPPEDLDEIREQLRLLSLETGPDWLTKLSAALHHDPRLELLAHPCGGWLLRGGRDSILGQFTDEDSSSSATVAVELHAHLAGVGNQARRYADGIGLPPTLCDDLELAGRLHDLGKADPRFQTLLHGGNPWLAAASGQILAKSAQLPATPAARREARQRSGYPQGGRHELLSVRLAESADGLLDQAHDRDLVLHLIASHHGHCRPFAPVIRDATPVDVTLELDKHRCLASSATALERLDSGISERFWLLVRRYGWWGIAWLEALLRLSDWRRSEEEQKTETSSPSPTQHPKDTA